MIASASGVAEAAGAALVVPPPPPAALAAGDGDAVVPQAATSSKVIPMAPSGERGRCMRLLLRFPMVAMWARGRDRRVGPVSVAPSSRGLPQGPQTARCLIR